MKIGVCTGLDQWSTAAEAGFDYIECALNTVAAMTEKEYQDTLRHARNACIPLYACNCMLPGDIKVTGPLANEKQQRQYFDTAFSRAHQLGASVVVFGSGGSRQIPRGFSFRKGWQQTAAFLLTAGEYGEKYNLNIAIEPLRRQECNLLNYVSEAVLLAVFVDHPRICVLGDTFHMASGGEPWQTLSYAGPLLRHMHISHCQPGFTGRNFPSLDDDGHYGEIIQELKEMRYEGNISIEAGTDDLLNDGMQAVEVLRAAMK